MPLSRRFGTLILLALLLGASRAWCEVDEGRTRAEGLLKEAQSLYQTNRMGEALSRAQAAVLASADFAEAHRWVGFLLALSGDKEQAIGAFARAAQYGDRSAYVISSLSRLLYTPPFPSYLEADSLAYLPVDFRRIEIPLRDARLGLGPQASALAVYSISAIYTPTVPCAGPDGKGAFNRISYVLVEQGARGRLATVAAIYYGSEFLWNSEWPVEAVVGGVGNAVARVKTYRRLYLQEPVEGRRPLSVWIYPEPGADAAAGDIRLYGALQGGTAAEWTARTLRMLHAMSRAAQGGGGKVAELVDDEMVAVWDAVNAAEEPGEAAWASLASFLRDFPPPSKAALENEAFIRGFVGYVAATGEVAALRGVLGAAGSGAALLSAYEQACLSQDRRPLHLTLPFGGPTSISRAQVAGGGPLTLGAGEGRLYWVVVGPGSWNLRVTGEGQVAATCDGGPAATLSLTPESAITSLGALEAGWHRLVLRNDGGAPATLTGAVVERGVP